MVDTAIVDGVSSMMGIIGSLEGQKQWSTQHRGSNLLDGGAPFYQCYETSDGRHMAVGCIEPQFFALMMEILGLSSDEFGEQLDVAQWPRQQSILADVYRSKTMAEWSELFDGTDACVTPVLTLDEAVEHKHNKARISHSINNGFKHPGPAPRFSQTEPEIRENGASLRGDTDGVLAFAGYSEDDKAGLLSAGAIKQ